MRENLSLLSLWGLAISLIAVTLFVVGYSITRTIDKGDVADNLRRRSVDIYLAAETREAEQDSKRFREAADEIERLRRRTKAG